jgi:hypothetical protein
MAPKAGKAKPHKDRGDKKKKKKEEKGATNRQTSFMRNEFPPAPNYGELLHSDAVSLCETRWCKRYPLSVELLSVIVNFVVLRADAMF